VATPAYLQPKSHDQILEVGTQLLDLLINKYSVAHIVGPPVEYIVNQAPGKLIVTVINNSGSDWNGSIVADPQAFVMGVSEYITDQPVPFSSSPAGLTIAGHVPAYGVAVFAVEHGGSPRQFAPTPYQK
jgi:hypothetical protein